LRNAGGTGSAVVSGLEAGASYAWQVYQYASLFPGKNALRVNGLDEGFTIQGKSDEPTMRGLTNADSRGQIIFSFTKNSKHVHLSGLAMRKLNEGKTEALLGLSQISFQSRRRGNRNLDRNNGYVYSINGYTWELKGWTHARTYAKGFLRNTKGRATAVASGLDPGALYAWKVYQYASQFGGKNFLKVSGESMGLTVASTRDAATKTGAHRADEKGHIVFEFHRNAHHVHLSGIALGKVQEAGDGYLSTVSDNNFDDLGDATLRERSSYVYKLANGYTCKLTGWTHSRRYAKGFLRNKKGTATAVVSGLVAGKLYAWKVYQYASQFSGKNKLRVNGGNEIWTVASKSDEPTRMGLTKASSSGLITFQFTRVSHHVHLSGIAIGKVEQGATPAVQAMDSDSLDACKASCEKKTGCKGVQFDQAAKRCTLWLGPFESDASTGTECLSWRPH